MEITKIPSFLVMVLCISFASLAYAGPSPMVERHIFSPEADEKSSFKSPMTLKLERELLFTGVIKTPQGRWAIIRPRAKSADKVDQGLRKEGDEINGMVIREIGRNYLILVGSGKEVRLNLYHEGKVRPTKTTGNASSTGYDDSFVSSSSSGSLGDGSAGADMKQSGSSPLAGSRQKKSKASSPGPNPFDQAMPSKDFPSAPVPQNMPPNPFMKNQDRLSNPFQQLQNTAPNPFPDEPDSP